MSQPIDTIVEILPTPIHIIVYQKELWLKKEITATIIAKQYLIVLNIIG
jgi:hypothetical protein